MITAGLMAISLVALSLESVGVSAACFAIAVLVLRFA